MKGFDGYVAFPGANIVVGTEAPRRSIIDMVGYAASVLNNSSNREFLYLPCSTISNGKSSVFLVNGDANILSELHNNNVLYSPYFSGMSSRGVTSMWNGVGNTDGDIASVDPDNLVPAPSTILVLGNQSSPDEVTKSLASTVEAEVEGKLQNFVHNSRIQAVTNAKEILSFLSK